jgi:uncharacterized protein YuzE
VELEATVDREADAAYVYLTADRSRPATKQVFVQHRGKYDIIIDFDETGKLLGVEIIGATAALDSSFLENATDITGPVADKVSAVGSRAGRRRRWWRPGT